MSQKLTPEQRIRGHTEAAVLAGLDRLRALLSAPDTPNADVLKGLTFLFEHAYRAGGDPGGDMEVRLGP